jgi:hypothetical protein
MGTGGLWRASDRTPGFEFARPLGLRGILFYESLTIVMSCKATVNLEIVSMHLQEKMGLYLLSNTHYVDSGHSSYFLNALIQFNCRVCRRWQSPL